MNSDSFDITIVAIDREAADAIAGRLDAADGDPLLMEKRGLDGGVGEWIISAIVALGGAKPFLDFALGYVKAKRVRSITWRDITIDNPRPEDIEQLARLVDDAAAST